jgi:diacylglycerol kinase family enzyme
MARRTLAIANPRAAGSATGRRWPRIAERLVGFPGFYCGAQLASAATALRRGSVVEAAAAPGAVPLELDGEPLGTLPARFALLPGTLSVIGPPA